MHKDNLNYASNFGKFEKTQYELVCTACGKAMLVNANDGTTYYVTEQGYACDDCWRYVA